MSDLISRQGALAKIRTRLQDWAAYGNEEYRRGLYACEDMIISLPSASQNLAEPNKTMKGSDLISRADAIDAVWKIVPVETEIDSTLLDKAEVIVELSVLPSADAVQGEWERVSADKYVQHAYHFYRCDKCGYDHIGKTNFCPKCGARMKGADDEREDIQSTDE